jgi:hypothetical protein
MFINSADDTNLVLVLFLECLKLVGPVAGVDSTFNLSAIAPDCEANEVVDICDGSVS